MAVQRKGAEQPRQQPAEQTGLADLYERDYYSWTATQVRALRARKIAELDWDNLAEEVEDLGKSERHRLESHLEGLLMHLLKWVCQPRRRSRRWSNSIREHRFRIQRVLRDNPSLKAVLPEVFADAYEGALLTAQNETGLDLNAYEICPWAVEEAPGTDFWPDGGLEKEERPRPTRHRSSR
jgi:hypothetical protein